MNNGFLKDYKYWMRKSSRGDIVVRGTDFFTRRRRVSCVRRRHKLKVESKLYCTGQALRHQVDIIITQCTRFILINRKAIVYALS